MKIQQKTFDSQASKPKSLQNGNSKDQNIVKQEGDKNKIYNIKRKRADKIKSQGKKKSIQNYFWTVRQNVLYIKYLIQKGSLFELSYESKKKHKTNLKLSKHVRSRTPPQCHSHHQKMMLKYGSVKNIINAYVNDETYYYNFDPQYLIKWNVDVRLRLDQKQQCQQNQGDIANGEIQQNVKDYEEKIQNILKEEENLDYIYYQTCKTQ